MRPSKVYIHTFIAEARSMDIVQSGSTPCRARAKAFTELEQRLVREKLPRQGWRLLRQRLMPLQGAEIRT